MRLTINGKSHEVDVDPTTPLLWVIREQVGLTGTKYGCGVAQCGACTVHVNGLPVRSCQLPVSAAGGAKITTIEGLAPGKTLHKVQKAWIDNDVPQCGYCQSGMIMAVAAARRTAGGIWGDLTKTSIYLDFTPCADESRGHCTIANHGECVRNDTTVCMASC